MELLVCVGFPQAFSWVFDFSGRWKVFTGNELAALFGWWMFTCWKTNRAKDADVKNVYMLATTVSSKILKAIAQKEGFHFEVRALAGLAVSTVLAPRVRSASFVVYTGLTVLISQSRLRCCNWVWRIPDRSL